MTTFTHPSCHQSTEDAAGDPDLKSLESVSTPVPSVLLPHGYSQPCCCFCLCSKKCTVPASSVKLLLTFNDEVAAHFQRLKYPVTGPFRKSDFLRKPNFLIFIILISLVSYFIDCENYRTTLQYCTYYVDPAVCGV